MTDTTSTEPGGQPQSESEPEHELDVLVMNAIQSIGVKPHSTDLMAYCRCGWREGVDSRRDARRKFERHMRRIAQGKPDLGALAKDRDDPRP